MKGFSPVWMHLCTVRLPLVEKHLWHISHSCTFFPFVWSRFLAPCPVTPVSDSNCFTPNTAELPRSPECVPSTRLTPPSATCPCWPSRRTPTSVALMPSAPGTRSRCSSLLNKTDLTSVMQKCKQFLQSCYKNNTWKITHCTPAGGPVVLQSTRMQVIQFKIVWHAEICQ